MKELLELIYAPRSSWGDQVRASFNAALRPRYVRLGDVTERRNDEKRFQLRVNGDLSAGAVPYAALIPADQEQSGPYGGMSFVIFPADEDGSPALIAMGIGTNGLAPDESILGRPGHGRKCAAIASWLNESQPSGFAWAKRDPVRIDLEMPTSALRKLERWGGATGKYGKVLYAVFAPTSQRSAHSDAVVLDGLKAFVDLFFEERRIEQKKDAQADADRIRRAWLACAFPNASDEDVAELLKSRRFVIVEGPPGTGKTELARRILKEKYKGNGREIQFHPGTTYDSFIGGLSPHDGGAMGFTFRPTSGHLLQVIGAANKNPDKRFLLLIDEINRADLAKVLGEAIFLFEPTQPDRQVSLQYNFPEIGSVLKLPKNVDVLGTMNSSDRSIAILDVAVRRRFAFVPLWPQLSVVEKHSGARLIDAFLELLGIFFEHASDEALSLLPGHSYFLGTDEEAGALLSTSVRPLLTEYLAQGYVAGFADEVRAYLDSIGQQS
jgi:5-methylcytosine-specific restriction protein B